MRKALASIVFCLLTISAFAGEIPSKVVKGRVYDKTSHEALAGVKVSVENSTQAVYTDFEGNFTLLITNQEKPVLSFSTVSYQTEKMDVNSSFSDVSINLSEL